MNKRIISTFLIFTLIYNSIVFSIATYSAYNYLQEHSFELTQNKTILGEFSNNGNELDSNY